MMQFFIVLLFCPLISALAFAGPEATLVRNAVEIQLGPRPTEAPTFKDLLKRLFKRKSSGNYILIEGPDGVCGYQFGSSSKSPVLNVLYTCVNDLFKAKLWDCVDRRDVDLP
jgi:hypothetical protein